MFWEENSVSSNTRREYAARTALNNVFFAVYNHYLVVSVECNNIL